MSDRREIYGENTKAEKEKSMVKVILDYVVTIAIVIGIGFFVMNFILVNAEIPSGSMENTIMAGDRVFGNRLQYKFSDPKRYDIVIFKYPDDESQLFIKRVIGLPNETVIITGGEVYIADSGTVTDDIPDEELINDPTMLPGVKKLDDSFTAEQMDTTYSGVFRVPEDSYFMMGDNRNHSKDSRFWVNKFVAKDKIIGKAVLRYWPLNKITLLGYDGVQE
ncbi:MAG: signal peptidase I [Candidatus Alectryocaccobium sp.]|jgi:signal peptidase I